MFLWRVIQHLVISIRQIFRMAFDFTVISFFRRTKSYYFPAHVDEGSSDTLFSSPFFDKETWEWVLKKIDELKLAPDTLGVHVFNPYWDARRITITLNYIRHFNLARGVVVEIGSPSYLASRIIWSAFPDVSPIFTANDLRFEPIPVADNTADSIICLEVIEHLSDWPYLEATTLNGLFFFLEEVWRVLKPGGRALFTTPNANSLWVISRALRGEPPMLYDWHFREYTVSEISQILNYVGFRIVELRTEYVWHLWDFGPIVQFMKQNGFDLKMRGDDIFVVATKPWMRIRIPHTLRLPVAQSK